MSASHDGRITEVALIRKLKRPDGSAVWPAYRTGEDRFGTWLFTPQGSLYRGEAPWGSSPHGMAWSPRKRSGRRESNPHDQLGRLATDSGGPPQLASVTRM
jgi:hypothetical protein